ncbi:MAG: C40 family peptidase [Pseudobutyrivibrio sp.]|nr:C40 family peptidase [Pseudobutyrivibrio sp.]
MKKRRVIKMGMCLGLGVCLLVGDPMVTDAVRSISEIEKEQDELQDEIDALDADLYSLVLQVEEVSNTIAETEAEIADTQAALEDAQIACDQQYKDMKIRIKYMYEKEEPSLFEMLIEAGSFSKFLNRLEYVNGVYSYDREKLDQFQATQAEIEALAVALDEEMQSLDAAKAELEAQEIALDAMLDQKQGEMDDLDKELKEAKEIAAREAALRAARAAAANNGAKTSAISSYNVNGDLNPGKTTGIAGSDVVSFANQYVGGAYVWGGNSLTGGCDCSGFVQQVLANYGITYGARMTSVSFRNVGNEVSYNYMQPGDIVCYPGHVAFYQGNGTIVEAQSTATGITNYRSVNCHSIITIRRVL